MKKKLIILISSLTLSLGALTILSGCKDPQETSQVEIVFRSNGGTTYYNVSGYAGETIELPTPEKEGYEFLGWYETSSFTGEALPEIYTIEIGRTLYAKWEAYEGTITFESNGGTTYYDVDFKAQKIELPTPSREGYLFDGWYDNESLTGDVYEGTILPTNDITLYAKWNVVTGTVHFISNGGTGYDSISTSSQLVQLPTPTKDDYIFAGWYDNENFEGKAIEGTYLPEGEVTLYARWAHSFIDVKLEENGGSEVDDIKLFDNDNFELPTPTRYGYSFEGWYTNEYLAGQPVDGYFYRPANDVTLYAKWSKCSYLYLFYNDPMEWVRFEFAPGTTLTVEELNDLYVPNDLLVVDSLGFEHNAPFEYWASLEYDETLNEQVTGSITLDSETLILSAKYDTTNVPADFHMTYDHETNVYSSNGKACAEFIEAPEKTPYVYSLDMSFRKDGNGAMGPAIRMDVANITNHFEKSCNYLSAVLSPSSGNLAFVSVYEGDYSKIGGVNFSSMPQSWKDKLNGAATNELVEFTMTMVDYGTYIEVYVDNVLAYTYKDATKLANYTYDGLGVRTSTYPANFYNPRVTYESTISFDTGVEGLTVASMTWLCGNLELPKLERDDYVLAGWYYDKELQNEVDSKNCLINGNTTLYAKWATDFYKISFDEQGGEECKDINWAGGKVNLPTPVKTSHVFTGWYYDKELTKLVDAENINVPSNITLYAGWRLPLHKFVVNNGIYIYTAKSVAVVDIIDNPIPAAGTYIEYKQTITKPKGVGSAGLAFRMDVGVDYAYETAGTNYLSVQFALGKLRISRVKNGNWTRLVGDRELTALPQSWQDKYATYAEGEELTVDLTVRDYGSYFEVYIDGVLAYTYAGTEDITTYTGNGYGIRASTTSTYANISAQVVTKN